MGRIYINKSQAPLDDYYKKESQKLKKYTKRILYKR